MIDLPALLKASWGDPAKKVTVSKKWLTEVHNELSELEKRREYDEGMNKGRSVLDRMAKSFGMGDKS